MTVDKDRAVARFAAVMERRTAATARVSETARFVGFGLLAIAYAMISDSGAFFAEMRTHHATMVRVLALAGSLAILADYLHYVFGYLTTQRALDRQDKPNTYNSLWLTYQLEIVCFWVKQAAAITGCFILLILVSKSF